MQWPTVKVRGAVGRGFVWFLLLALLAGCGRRPTERPPDPVRAQLEAMSLSEKIGQMVLIGVEGESLDAHARELIADDHVGGVILYGANITDEGQTVAFLNALKAANGSNKAALWLSVDQEGGRINRMPPAYAALPTSRQVGQSGSAEYASQVGALLADQAKSLGFNMNFAPVLDVNSNPHNPVIGDRSFGDQPDLVTRLGIAAMKGIQSEQVAAVVKHFPGHGDTSVDSHLDLPRVDKNLEQLKELELRPFQAAIGERADAVMVAHLLLPKLDPQYPASLSSAVIRDLLRGQLQYDGVVITDDMTMGAISRHFDIGEAAVQAIEAGADIVMVAHDYAKEAAALGALKQAVEAGRLSQQTIDRSVYRILALKHKYGLADRPTAEPDVAGINQRVRQTLSQFE